jgi:uncharacterized protein
MLHITNSNNGQTIVDKGRIADGFFTRLRGLLGVRELPPGNGLLIEGTNCIHTHFMSIPIDVVYLDREHRVVDVEEKMPPWRFGRLRRHAKHVLELPAGTVARLGLATGDCLIIAK